MLTHSYYEEDARVRRQAEALVGRGREVDVIALRRPGDPTRVDLAGVHVERVNVQRHQGAGILTYLREYLGFLLLASLAAARGHRHRRYGIVQVHTLPDFLVFGALPLRLAGVPVLLDMHEAMPEFYRSRFPGRVSRVAYALLRWQERVSIGFADAVLTVNETLAERLRSLGTPPTKITVVLNSPDQALFDPTRHPERGFMADGALRLVYAGAVTPMYELDVCLQAVERLASRDGLAVRLDIYGRGDDLAMLERAVAQRRLGERVTLHGRIPLEAVPAAIAAADIGLAPTRRDAFTDMSLSTKIFEYAAMGKPVVASRLAALARYFPAEAVESYTPGDPDDLVRSILRLMDEPALREKRVESARRRVGELSWDGEADRYATVIDRLALR